MSEFTEFLGILVSILRTIFHLIKSLILLALGQQEKIPTNNFPAPPAADQEFVKANARDPQYQTLAGLNDDVAFGFKKPSKPPGADQNFVKANARDPNYQTLAMVQDSVFDKKQE